jgi:hypothetical protein
MYELREMEAGEMGSIEEMERDGTAAWPPRPSLDDSVSSRARGAVARHLRLSA